MCVYICMSCAVCVLKCCKLSGINETLNFKAAALNLVTIDFGRSNYVFTFKPRLGPELTDYSLFVFLMS